MIPLFGLALIAVAAVIAWRSNAFASFGPAITEDPNLTQPPSSTLTGTWLPDDEIASIIRYANQYNIDARLLAAIRKAENGGPGREFGVLDQGANTYELQAAWAAGTIQKNIGRYESASGLSATATDGRYTDDFIAYLGNKYAPVGALNDPTGLNQNWIPNVESYYRSIEYA